MYQYSQHATTKSFYIYTNTVFIIQSIYITTEYNLGIPSKKIQKLIPIFWHPVKASKMSIEFGFDQVVFIATWERTKGD